MRVKRFIYGAAVALISVSGLSAIGVTAIDQAPSREIGIVPLDTVVGGSIKYGKFGLLPNVLVQPRNVLYRI